MHPPDQPGDENSNVTTAPAVEDEKEVNREELPIGPVLRQLRHERELSLRDVQRGAGISNPYLSNLELGIQKPGVRILERLSDYYGIGISDIFRRAELLRDQGQDWQRSHHADIERSFRFLMEDPHLEPYDKPTGTLPLEAKKFMVQLYEHYTGKQLLV